MKPESDKKADISIMILVIGVFGICALAIISFILYSNGNQGNFADMEIFENVSARIDSFYFYINSGLSPQDAADRIGAQLQDNKLILYAEQRVPTVFSFITKKEPDLVASVKYIVDLNK